MSELTEGMIFEFIRNAEIINHYKRIRPSSINFIEKIFQESKKSNIIKELELILSLDDDANSAIKTIEDNPELIKELTYPSDIYVNFNKTKELNEYFKLKKIPLKAIYKK